MLLLLLQNTWFLYNSRANDSLLFTTSALSFHLLEFLQICDFRCSSKWYLWMLFYSWLNQLLSHRFSGCRSSYQSWGFPYCWRLTYFYIFSSLFAFKLVSALHFRRSFSSASRRLSIFQGVLSWKKVQLEVNKRAKRKMKEETSDCSLQLFPFTCTCLLIGSYSWNFVIIEVLDSKDQQIKKKNKI